MIIIKNIYNHRGNLDRSVIELDGSYFFGLKVYDNGGKTLDRYTVVYLHSRYKTKQNYFFYSMFAMSENPFEGFGQHCEGQIGKHLGKKINFDDLPALCQKAVIQDLTN